MKVSKKIFIPVLIIIALVCIFGGTKIYRSKYPLPNIKSSQIKTVKIYHNNNSKYLTTHNSDGLKILNYLKNIASKTTTSSEGGGFIGEDFCTSMSSSNPDNYYIEINFTSEVNFTLQDASEKCDTLIIDVNEKVLYYHNSEDFTLKLFDTSNADFSKLSKFLNSKFK